MALKVLAVEDDPDVGMLLIDNLRSWGFQPTWLQMGGPVVPWVRANRPAVVLLDLMLPDVDGYDICEALKLDRDTNVIPVIMVTARTQPADRIRGLEVGANCYLTKPFSLEDLHLAVTEALTWRDELGRRGTTGEVRFHLRSDTQHLEDLNKLLASLFLFTPLTEVQVKQLTMAIRELGANAIEWGHRKQADRIVTVTYQIDPTKISIVIRDTGPGFDPGQVPHAASPDDPIGHLTVRETLGLRPGGFGIMMARGLVDDLRFNEAGNEVRLVKCFPAPAALGEFTVEQGA